MSSKKLIIVASDLEAQPLKKYFSNQNKWQINDCQLVLGTNHDLLITGIGLINSAYAISKIEQEAYQEWINLGVAGNLNNNNSSHIIEISKVVCPDLHHPFDRSKDNLNTSNENGQVCISVGKAVHDINLRNKLSLQADLVDMELYSIAYAANLVNQPLYVYKAISDQADQNDTSEIIKKIPILMQELWDYISEKIN